MDMLNIIISSISTCLIKSTDHTDVNLSIKTTLNYLDIGAERCAFVCWTLYKNDVNLVTLDWRCYYLMQNYMRFHTRAIWKSVHIHKQKSMDINMKQNSKSAKKSL